MHFDMGCVQLTRAHAACSYETKLTNGEKVAGTFQLHAVDLSKPPKFGFAVDLS